MSLVLPGSTSGSVTIDAPAVAGSTALTLPTSTGTLATTAQLARFRNRIINGDMRIDQRNAGASATLTSTQTYNIDRWSAAEDTDGTMTAQQSTVTPIGFVNSLLFTTGTADASLSASQFASVRQLIEGLNVGDLGWGTANAKTVTVSFWVRSSLTGTFGGSLRNSAGNRSYPFSYTITTANTWEYETITIAGDTTGTWLTTNGIGINLTFSLGAGSNLEGTAGAWNSNNNITVAGATSVIGIAGATFYITGVQLEVGTSATGFEYVDYTTQLAMCQRYFVANSSFPAFFNGSGTILVLGYPLPSALRTTPSLSYTGTINGVNFGTATYYSTNQPADISQTGTNALTFTVSGFGGTPGGGACGLAGQTIKISAEL